MKIELSFKQMCNVLICLLFLLGVWIGSAHAEVIFTESFESEWGDWYAENGIWDIGTPTAGPESCHGGSKCAATNLNGNYEVDTDSRLISPPIILPQISDGEEIHLRFWQWFSYARNDGGKVQISVYDENQNKWSDWQDVGTGVGGTSGNYWTLKDIDLTEYAGKKIKLAFFHMAAWWDESTGWYIDDIEIVKKVLSFTGDFESGWGDWYADNGIWDIGTPTAGPESCHGGSKCAATNLSGNYEVDTDSRLISAPITLPQVSDGGEIHLRFWQWFSYAHSDGGKVQISVYDENQNKWSDWQDVGTGVGGTSGDYWTLKDIDLTEYAGKKIKLAFFHMAAWWDESTGWYIDDIEIKTVGMVSPSDNQHPIIDSFTVDPLEGDAPLTVTFTCEAHDPDGNIDSFKWDLDGDGNIDQITNAGSTTHTYNEAGVYPAKCTVVDNNGATISSEVKTITVNTPECDLTHLDLCTTEDECTQAGGYWYHGQCQSSPCANQYPVIDSFTVDPLEGDTPLTVTFNCQAHDPDGNIASFKWDFNGDGNFDQITDSGSTTHTYNEAGVYPAKCTVVDNDVATVSSEVKTITVNTPECDLTHLDLCTTEDECTHAGGYWCHGQCQSSPCANQYPVIDSFTVDPLEGDAPLTVTFTCQAHDPDGNIASFKWDFNGDGNFDQITDSGLTTHTYNEAGVYHAKCTVVDNDGATVKSQSVEINVSEGGGNCLDENCPEGQSCLCFEALKCNSGEDSCEEDDFFRVGDHFKLNLCINAEQSNRFELVDLYVGIIPLQTNSLFLVTWNPWNPVVVWDGGEINSDVAYRQNLGQYSACYTIYDFEVPPGIGGTYDLYALFNRAGHPLDVFSLLSNLAYKRITFEDMR